MREPLKYRGKYRIASTRLSYHDYGSGGDYFVTICTKHRAPWFGDIRNGIMCLSEMGQMAHHYWNEISNHFETVVLGEFIIMPDHMHGIIQIRRQVENNGRVQSAGRVETYHDTSLQHPHTVQQDKRNNDRFYQKIAPKSGSLGSIIRGYKQSVTIKSRSINPYFSWQSRFYERIIRNDKEYDALSNYIRLNVENWKG